MIHCKNGRIVSGEKDVTEEVLVAAMVYISHNNTQGRTTEVQLPNGDVWSLLLHQVKGAPNGETK